MRAVRVPTGGPAFCRGLAWEAVRGRGGTTLAAGSLARVGLA